MFSFSHQVKLFAIFAFLIFSVVVQTQPVSAQGVEEELFSEGGGGEADFFKTEEQVVVSASKRAQKISESPVAISVINESDIEAMNPQSIPDILRIIPGVYVQRITGGQYEVSIRGNHGFPGGSGPFSAFSRRVLVLVNGRSFFNDSFGGTQWSQLPITADNIKRIEVVRGPASPLFGANAVTGVINIITKDPVNLADADVEVSIEPGSDNHNRLRASVPGEVGGWNFLLTAEKSQKDRFDPADENYEEYDVNKGVSVNSYDGINPAGLGAADSTSLNQVGYFGQKTHPNNDLYGLTEGANGGDGGFKDGRGDADNTDFPAADGNSLETKRFNLMAKKQISDVRSLQLEGGMGDGHQNFFGSSGGLIIFKNPVEQAYGKVAYEDEYEGIPVKLQVSYIDGQFGDNPPGGEAVPDGPLGERRDGTQGGLGWGSWDVEAQGIWEWSSSDVLVFGGNWRTTEAESKLYYRDVLDRTNKKAEQTFTGAYFNNEHQFNESWKFVLAGRYDDFQEPDDSAFSPQSILIYQPAGDSDQMWRLNWAQSIRAPFLTELFMNAPAGRSELYNHGLGAFDGNSELEIPKISSVEFGFRDKYWQRLEIDANLYHTAFEDAIGFRRVDDPEAGLSLQFDNYNETLRSSGGELEVKYPLTRSWSTRAAYTYQQGEFGSRDMKSVPTHLLALNLTGKIAAWNLSVTGQYAGEPTVTMKNVFDRNIDEKMDLQSYNLDLDGDGTKAYGPDLTPGTADDDGQDLSYVLEHGPKDLDNLMAAHPNGGNGTSESMVAGQAVGLIDNGTKKIKIQGEDYVTFNVRLSRTFHFGKTLDNAPFEFALIGEHLGESHREYVFGEKLEPVYRTQVSWTF